MNNERKNKHKKNNKNENVYIKEFSKGLFRENPTFILLIGLCPALAVTTMLTNGIGMGIATAVVLIFSNIIITILRNFIPEKVRMASYIVIIAALVTIVEFLINLLIPHLSSSLGIYLPLIAVNCIIIERAEAFANKNSIGKSIMDALGMGIGFTMTLILLSFIREFLGTTVIDFSDFIKINGNDNSAIFTLPVVNKETSEISIDMFGSKVLLYSGANIFVSPAGALFVFGLILAVINAFNSRFSKKVKK